MSPLRDNLAGVLIYRGMGIADAYESVDDILKLVSAHLFREINDRGQQALVAFLTNLLAHFKDGEQR